MSISSDFLSIIRRIYKIVDIPSIISIYFPQNSPNQHIKSRKDNFGAIQLEDGSIGIVYIALSPEVRERGANINPVEYKGLNPVELADQFDSHDFFQKTLSLGAINAISQFIFRKVNFQFDFTTDSLGLLNLDIKDKVGMVGFFPPLVKQIEEKAIPLIIIEKKEELVQKKKNWEVTLDLERLSDCNKVLCTSTTVLNESIDEILRVCSNAEKISVVGPTAGFFPDPLFSRGIDIIGGSYVHDSKLFIELISNNVRWGASTKKYCIQKNNYPGIDSLLGALKSIY